MLFGVSSSALAMTPVSNAPSRVNVDRFRVLLAAHRNTAQLKMADFLGRDLKGGGRPRVPGRAPVKTSVTLDTPRNRQYTVLNYLVAWLPGYPTASSELGRSLPIKPQR